MSDSKCKGCGEPMQWIGNMLDGSLRCTVCENAPNPAERARGVSFRAWWEQQSEEEKTKMFGKGGASLRGRYLDSVTRKAAKDAMVHDHIVVVGVGGQVTFVPAAEYFVGAPTVGTDAPPKESMKRWRIMDGCHCPLCQEAREKEDNLRAGLWENDL